MTDIIQVLWRDGTIHHEESFESNSDTDAKKKALSVFEDPTMEGDHVRVITPDGELIYHSLYD